MPTHSPLAAVRKSVGADTGRRLTMQKLAPQAATLATSPGKIKGCTACPTRSAGALVSMPKEPGRSSSPCSCTSFHVHAGSSEPAPALAGALLRVPGPLMWIDGTGPSSAASAFARSRSSVTFMAQSVTRRCDGRDGRAAGLGVSATSLTVGWFAAPIPARRHRGTAPIQEGRPSRSRCATQLRPIF
jgi:hypothetical protein